MESRADSYRHIALTLGPGLVYALAADLVLPVALNTESPRAFVAAIVAITIASIVGQCLSYRRQRSLIEGLRDHLARLRSGDLGTRSKVRLGRIGSLAYSVNELATQLQNASEETRAREVALQKTIDVCQAELRRRSLYLASLTRELQDPINGILDMSHLALDKEPGAEVSQIMDSVIMSGLGLLGILRDLSDFSNLQAGNLEIRQEVFGLHLAIKKTIGRHVFSAHAKGLKLKCKIAQNVPYQAIGDEDRLRQVLGNFLDNAIKHTEEGEVSVMATVDSSMPSKTIVRIAVMDTGSGVCDERRDSLFVDPHQDSNHSNGSAQEGLGLATCRDLAELMGGTVGAETSSGRGSSFWFTVSVGKFADRGAEVDAQSTAPRARILDLPIMVFTDDPDLSAQLLIELSKAGFAAEFQQIRGNLAACLEKSSCGMVLLDGERPELVATMASWKPCGGAMQIPVVGIPKHADGSLHRPFLATLVHEWMGEEEVIEDQDGNGSPKPISDAVMA